MIMSMAKRLYALIFIIVPVWSYAQIADYNHFPAMRPFHILDDKLDNISFAMGMRVLVSDYNGPLVKLRRASDDEKKDFTWGDNDIVDVAAIDAWRGSSDVYVHTWYDQSGLGRNAVQADKNRQPKFDTNATYPYFQGDGNDDHLTIDTSNGIQDLIFDGKVGVVLTIMRASTKQQHAFGVLTYRDRWSAHVNWDDNHLYFDPGYCCNNTRDFYNADKVDKWTQYTLMRTSSERVIARVNGTEKFNGKHDRNCTRTEDFAIGWATGDQPGRHATTQYLEFIMYKMDIPSSQYEAIEENAITFWGL